MKIRTFIALLALVLAALAQQASEPRVRARDLGIQPGVLPTGRLNAITDVAGVKVGHVTLRIGDSVRTGSPGHTGSAGSQRLLSLGQAAGFCSRAPSKPPRYRFLTPGQPHEVLGRWRERRLAASVAWGPMGTEQGRQCPDRGLGTTGVQVRDGVYNRPMFRMRGSRRAPESSILLSFGTDFTGG